MHACFQRRSKSRIPGFPEGRPHSRRQKLYFTPALGTKLGARATLNNALSREASGAHSLKLLDRDRLKGQRRMPRSYGTGIATGLAIGVAAALFRPLWAPVLARVGRPAAKTAIKQGVLAYEIGRERVAELGETMSDLMAEAQFELGAERAAEAPPRTSD